MWDLLHLTFNFFHDEESPKEHLDYFSFWHMMKKVPTPQKKRKA
jgi:hypothetical protein